jgi:hypothetical protein
MPAMGRVKRAAQKTDGFPQDQASENIVFGVRLVMIGL